MAKKVKNIVKREETPVKHSEESKKHEERSSPEPKQGCGKSFDTVALFIAGLIVGLAIGGLMFSAMGSKEANTTADPAQLNAVGSKAVDFITANLISEGDTIVLLNVSPVENTGIYQVKVNYTSGPYSQIIDSYATKDVELLCPSGILTAEFEAMMQEQEQEQQQEEQKDPEEVCAQLAKAEKPVLEAYVVSNCPFGLQMQRIMYAIVQNTPEAAQYLTVRYMGEVSNGKVTSMHGDAEAQENLRQICIREEQSDKYWGYVGCYMQEGKSEDCLTSAKVDKAKLEECMSDASKGVEYAKEDFELSDKYQVTGSPTLIMNQERVSEFDFAVDGADGRSAEAAKNLLCCGFNTKPAFCSTELAKTRAATMYSDGYDGAGSTGSC
ncbi:MAG: hypothetical protein JW727_02275 [Candidatus Aenigmarchaeota archaeon]|nr:hypothetical protein [Candidatus Aenigmarchaeota archaeon]